eukprot:GHVS01065479.1.p2 GENE.GHVS01065479.1~~GHVS01065479.1.p2  ORF type:complete len:162 (+),score=26.83 GHVS01065479.1:1201-1686(+)
MKHIISLRSSSVYSANGLAVHYRLKSTVIFSSSLPTSPLSTDNSSSQNWATLTSYITKTSEFSQKLEDSVGPSATSADEAVKGPSHISAIGRMIEDVEISTRRQLEDVYMIKPVEVLDSLRDMEGHPENEEGGTSPAAQAAAIVQDLSEFISRHKHEHRSK